MMNPNLVILAGGISSRMRQESPLAAEADTHLLREAEHKAKSMLGVGSGGRPFMDYLLYNAREAGYRDVVIVVGESDESVRPYYGQSPGSFPGVSISYALQRIPPPRTKPLGTADALLCALTSRPDWSGGKFTVCNSDNLYSREVLRLLLLSPHPGALIDFDRDALQFEQERIAKFAVLQKDADGYLVRIIEKPSVEEMRGVSDPHGRVGVSMNIFRLSYDLILPALEEVPLHPLRQEKELPVAVTLMLERHPHSVFTIPVAEYVPDMTSRSDISHVQQYLRDHFPPTLS